MKKKIGNVGVLDLRETKPEALENIECIENAGAVFVSEETEQLVAQLSFTNLGAIVTVPKDCKLVNGDMELDHASFASSAKINCLVNGTLKIHDDVTKDDLVNGIEFLGVNGLVICPKELILTLRQQAEHIEGKVISLGKNAKLLIGKHELNRAFFKTLKESANIVVPGRADMFELLNAEDLSNLESLEIIGKLNIAEDNYELLGEKLVQSPALKIFLIPAGYTYIQHELTLNTGTLQRFKQAKIFTGQRVVIEKGVSAEDLQQAITHLRTTGRIVCPESLKNIVLAISDVPSDMLLTYSEELVMIKGKHRLTAAELKYRPSHFTLMVHGRLEIAEDVAPDELFQRLEHVDYFGKISAGDEICGVLQAKVRTSKGKIQNLDKPEEKKPEDTAAYLVENVGYFKL